VVKKKDWLCREFMLTILCATGSRHVISARGLAIPAKASLSFAMMLDLSDFAGVNVTRTYVPRVLLQSSLPQASTSQAQLHGHHTNVLSNSSR
jgi:hypothetical protein